MQVEISINGRADDQARYLTWTPAELELRLTDPGGAAAPVALTLRTSGGSVGQLAFWSAAGAAASATLAVTATPNGAPVRVLAAGEFQRASRADRDTTLEIVGADGAVIDTVPLMIRVRKDANTLAPDERDRFVAAFAALNNRGAGPFRTFRDMHVTAAQREAHFDVAFLPWHRAYLLDLERTLQSIDPSVALHYWRFDQPSPNVFDPDFFGVADAAGDVAFSASNPLQYWSSDGVTGLRRRPFFDPATDAATTDTGTAVASELATLRIGQAAGSRYVDFVTMEGQPHGVAHVSFEGYIDSIGTAARDPLFFMLHANVDRLWARWQWYFQRFDPALPASYVPAIPPKRVGHNLADTMWPWNGQTGVPRPATAPGGFLQDSPTLVAPGKEPTVGSMLDYQGRVSAAGRLGFDYDDVPFE
jgi:tyrosinase